MTPATFPTAAEVRSGMRRMEVAFERVRTLQRAQIAQHLNISGRVTIHDRVEVMRGLVEALGSLNEASVMYLALCGLAPDEEVESVVDGSAE